MGELRQRGGMALMLNPMEQRLIDEAKTAGEAERLRDLFLFRRRLLRRALAIILAIPVSPSPSSSLSLPWTPVLAWKVVSILVGLLVYGGMAEQGQKLPVEDDYIAGWDANDPKLIDHIRHYYVYQPAKRDRYLLLPCLTHRDSPVGLAEPYNLLWPDKKDWSHKRQSMVVDEILGGRRGGFFFEAGAYDGETYSNSLYFEKYLDWSGVTAPHLYPAVRAWDGPWWTGDGGAGHGEHPQVPGEAPQVLPRPRLHRGQLTSGEGPCSLTKRAAEGAGDVVVSGQVSFYGSMETGTTAENMNTARYWFTRLWRPIVKFDTWCWPLISILKAVNHTKVLPPPPSSSPPSR